jgi:peptidyl-prolyl cis-trans isomerase B (cyclophilin B)
MRKILKAGFLLLIAALFFSCSEKKVKEENQRLKEQISELKMQVMQYEELGQHIQFLIDQMKGVKGRIVTNYGNIEIKFFPRKAPITCFNFITHAESGYYDGLLFHRVIKDFMIQGGDPNTRTANVESYGLGGPLVHIPNEFNDLPHDRGMISMARPSNPALGAGSQFFIVQKPARHLDHQYTVFAQVTHGMDVVDKIASVPTDKDNHPLLPVKIIKIDVFK